MGAVIALPCGVIWAYLFRAWRRSRINNVLLAEPPDHSPVLAQTALPPGPPNWTSRKFLLTVALMVLVIFKKQLDLSLEQILALMGTVTTYNAVEGSKDFLTVFKTKEPQ